MKRRILITGPILDFGGREVEIRSVTSYLQEYFEVKILSTGNITSKSVAILDEGVSWTSLKKEVLKKSKVLFLIITLISFIIQKKQKVSLLSNRYIKKMFNVSKMYKTILEQEISSQDVIVFFGQLQSAYLKEIIHFCNKRKVPFYLRTTGTIFKVSDEFKELAKGINTIINHSKSNTLVLNKHSIYNTLEIDQSTNQENKLLRVKKRNDKVKFGFIGSFSKEKGVLELIKYIKEMNIEGDFIFAGKGLLDSVIETANINCIGEIPYNQVDEFYNQVDVVVISSYHESGPFVGIEAAAAGKIILTTDVGAMKERFEGVDGVFWFDIHDFNSFKTEYKRIKKLSAEGLENISIKIRKRYLEKFSEDNIKKAYIEVFSN